jgi:hypothetical protein
MLAAGLFPIQLLMRDKKMFTDSSNFKSSEDNFQAQGLGEININDASEVRRWTQHWNVSEVELRKVVAEVGTEVNDIRTALGK